MVVETSALVAILLFEPQREELLTKIATEGAIISSSSILEAHMVLSQRYGPRSLDVIEAMLFELSISVVAFTAEHASEAARAFNRFGKGRHPAALNFGDCMAYATSKLSGQPLLFVGNDFSKTDIRKA